MESDTFRERVEQEKRVSVGQLLFRCARLFNEQALQLVRERAGLPGLRNAHTQLFPHIDWEGTRLTEIASRVGVSKQAVSQWVKELEAFGVLERVPDPEDRRARLVRFCSKGPNTLLAGLAVLQEMEDGIGEEVGRERMKALQSILVEVLDVLEARQG